MDRAVCRFIRPRRTAHRGSFTSSVVSTATELERPVQRRSVEGRAAREPRGRRSAGRGGGDPKENPARVVAAGASRASRIQKGCALREGEAAGAPVRIAAAAAQIASHERAHAAHAHRGRTSAAVGRASAAKRGAPPLLCSAGLARARRPSRAGAACAGSAESVVAAAVACDPALWRLCRTAASPLDRRLREGPRARVRKRRGVSALRLACGRLRGAAIVLAPARCGEGEGGGGWGGGGMQSCVQIRVQIRRRGQRGSGE